MSRNPLYANEIASAFRFLEENQNDEKLLLLVSELEADITLLHSDRWSIIYDYLAENYPSQTSLATGLTYLMES